MIHVFHKYNTLHEYNNISSTKVINNIIVIQVLSQERKEEIVEEWKI